MRINKDIILLGLILIFLAISPVVGAATEPIYGGEVVIYSPQDFDYLDAHRYVASGTEEVMMNIFEGLVKPAPDGSVVPAVASSYEIAPNNREYIFSLREGIKFHNGEYVTVEDIRYSLERLIEYRPAEFANIKSIDIINEQEVKVVLSEVDAAFVTYLIRGIVPQSNEGLHNQHPIGTGPFKFVDYMPESRLRLERFADYWQEGLPYLDKAEFRIIPDREAALMAFEMGQIDIYPRLDHIHMDYLSQRFNFVTGLENMVQLMVMNNKVEPFDDINVRKAINYAIDVDEIIELVAYGYGIKLGSNFSPAMEFYYLEGLENRYDQDLERARALLKQANYQDGFRMELVVPSVYDFHVDTAQVIASQLERVGVRTDIKLVEWGVWLESVYRGRDYQATIISLTGKLDPHQVLRRYVSDFTANFYNFEHQRFDELINLAIREVDENKRVEMYQEAQQILSDEVPAVYIMDRVFNVGLQPNLAGFKVYPLYLIDLTHIHYTQ